MFRLVLLACFFWSLAIFVSSDPTVVSLTSGKYQGEHRNYFKAFEGIPYAEAPTGENRFEPPKPYTETWDDVREAKKYGPKCMQWLPGGLEGVEDCLTLNVYVPDSVFKSHVNAPVVFFIHGGGFMWGGSDFYNPINMMKQELILVTFNYRLGPLGFMSTEGSTMPGNFGLKDQALALKWVNDNIDHFKGDNKKITISGWSAGGASVQLFYMSPLTKGLFKNGISHSGSALNPWVIQENAKEKAYHVAVHLNCSTDDNLAMLKCLKDQPAEKIVSSVALFQPFMYNPFAVFGVVVELPSDHAFLLDLPSKLLMKGEIHKAPWIASATFDEGAFSTAELLKEPKKFQEMAENWDSLAPHLLDYNGTSSDQTHKTMLAETIRLHHCGNRTISQENFRDLRTVFSDRLSNYGIAKAIELQSTIAPTYFYFFGFKSEYGLVEMMSGRSDLGVAHGEDVFILFPLAKRTPLNSEEEKISSNLIEMYRVFAHGNEAQFGGVPIQPVVGKTINYMEIQSSSKFGMKSFKEDSYGNQKFWDKELNFQLEN